jgi:RNA polymerase sigma-70 factor (ECF subfamily)
MLFPRGVTRTVEGSTNGLQLTTHRERGKISMDSQSTRRDRKSFDETSEGPKNSGCLLQLPCSGNQGALDDLFASSSSHLYQAAFRILSNPHDAEDAVQDSLLCALRKLNQFHGRSRFSTWLHRIAINSSLMRLRKRKCRREFPLEPVFTGDELVAPGINPLSDDPNPEEQCARVEQRKILSEALLKLPGPFRMAIALCDLEGLPTKDAAQRLGVPLSTIKARLFRSRRALKAAIRGRLANPRIRAADKNARWHRPVDEAAKMESLPAA